MTDKEKLDKFVAEIERLKKIVDDPILSDNDLIIGERNTYMRLLSFYDSMQEEPVNNGLDLGCGVIWKDEEPASEDLGKVGSLKSREYYPEKKTTNKTSKGVFDANMPRRKAYLRGFKDGAHAHKELIANKPVSEDLEKVSFDNAQKNYKEGFRGTAMQAFNEGAEWQKQKMMKDAIETIIIDDWQYGKDKDHTIIPAIHQRIDGCKVGEKVKVIVINED